MRFFGASHVFGGIHLVPTGEYCTPDGMLYGQQPVDEYRGIWECWRCGGAGILKMYLPDRRVELVLCDVCQGRRTSGVMPALMPRHVHSWQPDGQERWGWEPQRCDCGARWLKRRETGRATAMMAGMTALASLLPEGGTAQEGGADGH